MATKEYVTSSGYTLTISPLSRELSKMITKTVEYPKPPFYEVEILGGEKEKVAHTFESLETDEHKLEWKQYISARNRARVEEMKQKSRIIFNRCVDVELPEDAAWIILQEEAGIEVPEDPRLRKVHFIKTECVSSETDLFAVVDAAEVLSRFDAEEYQDALNLFRDILPKREESE